MVGFADYLRFVVTLTAVVDPFLAVPLFLSVTAAWTGAQRGALARTVALTVFVVLSVSAFFGEALLQFIGASLPAFRVGGGLVLLLMALAMLNAQAGGVRQSKAEAAALEGGEVGGVVPLAIPLLAGPGAISTAIIATEGGPLVHQLVIVACIGVVCLVAWLTLRAADRIAARLG
ncbi:MAG: MarC family protein, partial [Burkholderiales bacterium]